MSNLGRYKDRNADMRAAGVPTACDQDDTARTCLIISHPEEVAEQFLRAECKRLQLQQSGNLWPETPCLPTVTVPELLAIEKSKTRFTEFREKFSEDMYAKQAKLGQVKPTGSTPKDVTNWSRTFGCNTQSKDRLYEIILPPKKPEQVNQEFVKFHDKYLISHNHYFPSEQVNRKYAEPFDRRLTFGDATRGDKSGQMTKRCMEQCAGNVVIISKEQMDFIDRTYPRLGRKPKKYLSPVPQYMTYGRPTYVPDCDCKMLVEDIQPCQRNQQLVDALAHLNMCRHMLKQRPNFQMFDLISVLEQSDKEQRRELPLQQMFEIMHKLRIHIDVQKMRTILSLFQMIRDEHCASERVNYDDFCRLLNIQHRLPTTGNILSMPTNVYNKDTTYRLLCADLAKQPTNEPIMRPKRAAKALEDSTRAKQLIMPDIMITYGLTDNDFQQLRPRDQLQTIFKDIVSSEEFETIWQQLGKEFESQQQLYSVQQFRDIFENL